MYELGIVDVRAVFDGTRMRQIAFTDTEVASSETARNIDRGVVPSSSAGANPFRARTWLAFPDCSAARFP
jgi:hypothetical protein